MLSRVRAKGLGLRARRPRSARSPQPSALSPFRVALVVAALVFTSASVRAADPLPELTQPVNDFAHVIDPSSAAQMERMIRALQAASGDVVVVATVPTIEPYGDIREYAVKLFENHGRGIGQKGKNNGLLILLALKERRVWVEVGYDLEQWITDGFAGETSRNVMTPSSGTAATARACWRGPSASSDASRRGATSRSRACGFRARRRVSGAARRCRSRFRFSSSSRS